MKSPTFYALATDKVRHVGDPLALVVAESRYIAEDALELIVEDIEMLDPIVTYEDALDPTKPPVFDELGDNVYLTAAMSFGDVDAAFAEADRVVRASIDVHRHQPVPMECRGLIASWDSVAEQLTIHASTQSPHMMRMILPAQMGIPMDQIRVLAGDVGGGFGLKNSVTREDVAIVAAAKDLGRPVKWIEDRLEHLATGGQAREEMADLEAAVTADGRDSRSPHGRQGQRRRLPERSLPRCHPVLHDHHDVPGADAAAGARRQVGCAVQQQGHLRVLPGTVGDCGLPARATARHRRRTSSASTRSMFDGATTWYVTNPRWPC